MSALMGGSKRTPQVKDSPPAPERTASEIADAAAQQRNRFYSSGTGRASTILSSGLGTNEVSSAAVKLLGNSGGV